MKTILQQFAALIYTRGRNCGARRESIGIFTNGQGRILKVKTVNSQHPNIHFTMEKEINHVLPFLDVLLDKKAPHFPVNTAFRKKTFTGVLTNVLSFTPLCYKIGLNKPSLTGLLRSTKHGWVFLMTFKNCL